MMKQNERPMMERRSLALCVALVVMVLLCTLTGLTGCAGTQSTTASSSRTIEDVYGRSVEIPNTVESVATVGSGARFVVYAGGQDKLVAVTDMETTPNPARPYTEVYAELFATLPSTSNGNHLMETSVDTEQLLSIKPDLIISSRSAEECDSLQSAIGIPVVGISYQDQLFSDDVYNSILVVGESLGTSAHAESVVTALKAWADDLDSRTAKIADAEKPTVYVGAVNYKGAKSFGGTYARYAPLDAVNGINVADASGQSGSLLIELEQLGEWNPDYLFLNAGNMDLMKQDYGNNAAFFQNLAAFQEDTIYSQPSFNYNGTNVEMGICDAYFIGATIYPDAFADIDLPAQYDEVFSTMLGKDYYETMKSFGMDFKQISFGA